MLRTPRAAIYARISDDREGFGLGVARQVKACQELADREGWSTAEYVDNDISAYSGRLRPSYQRMVADVADGIIDVVIAWANDRLHRHPRELEDFIDLIEATGTKVVTVTSGAYDLATPEGRTMARVVGAMARGESERKAVRVVAKHQELAEHGLPSGGGPRPFGYASGPDPLNPSKLRLGMALDETEAPLIREAADRLLAGELLGTVVSDWHRRDIRGVRGNLFQTKTLRTILLSPRIAGLRERQGRVVGKAAWPAIISEDEHEQLKAVLEPRHRRSRPTRTHALTGLLWCGPCDVRMNSGRRKDGAREYVCKTGPNRAGCGRISSLAEPLEEFLVRAAIHAIASGTLPNKLAEAGPNPDTTVADIRALEARLEALNNDHYVDGILDRGEFLAARSQLKDRLDGLRDQLAAETRPSFLDDLPDTAMELQAIWDDEDTSTQWRTAFLSAVFDRVLTWPAVRGRTRFDPTRFEPLWKA